MPLDFRQKEKLYEFQIAIAERWRGKGQKAWDPFSKFFFFFAGFNDLYFLWKQIDGDPGKEDENVSRILAKLSNEEADKPLAQLSTQVNYFKNRSPIQSMGDRSSNNQSMGKDSEGKKLKAALLNSSATPSERLVAFGGIIYLVRCNLVHGNKIDSGDDETIIMNTVCPLELILETSLSIPLK